MDERATIADLERRLAAAEAALREKSHVEATLRESEARYRTLFETMGQGCVEVEVVRDVDGRAVDYRYLELNAAFERLFAIPVAQAKGRTGSEVFPGLESIWHEAFDRIVRRGEPERLEYREASLDRWFVAFAYPQGVDRLIILSEDVTEHKRAEAALRESEERQAFLLKLSDALRPLVDPVEVLQTAMRLVLEHFGVDSAVYHEFDAAGDRVITREGITNDRIAMPEVWRLRDFGFEEDLKAGRAIWYEDTETDPRLKDSLTSYRATRIRAGLGVTLLKGGRLAAMVGLTDSEPRAWPENERRLVETVAERTWEAVERARAESALRNSEARFQQFAKASAAGLWIRTGKSLDMEFTSPAIAAIYGLEPDELLGSVERWAALIVPEDRDTAIAHLEAARRGDVAVHEFRIQRPSDGAFRWIRNTDFPLHDDGDIPHIGGITEDVTETRRLIEHQSVLLAELQHRVRNIMGMIRSMANRTAGGATGIEDYQSLLEGRLLALARVQTLLTREANAGGSLRGIIESEVVAQAHRGDQATLTGPDIQLSPKAVEVLTLAFHELATNALKYGAFSVPEGRLTVGWTTVEKRGAPWLALDWIEDGAPPHEPSTRRGFGSELIEARIPYELGGRGKIALGPNGARCRLEFPLKDGESILETDAPQPATVFGGTLDMTGAPDLTGRSILVVEDDYYMAHDTAAALRGAGATVLGPCPSLDATRDLLEDDTPTHAVLDLNLGGGGPNFEIARMLKARGVPFVFLTGYDPNVIPDDMADVVRLQKPLPFRAIIEALAQL